MKFKVEKHSGYVDLVVTTDKLDTKVAPDLKSQFIMLANDGSTGGLIIGLDGINFADSSGLSALLLAYRLYRDANRPLTLYGVGERVRKLIEISQLTNVFSIAVSRDDAVQSVTGSPE